MPQWTSGATPVGRQLADADKFIGAGDDPLVLTSFTIGDVFDSVTGSAIQSDIADVQSTLSDLQPQLMALGADVQIVSTASATITTARHVIVTYTGGTCTLTLPNAYASREMWIIRAHTSARDIVLARSAADVTASGTINGTAGSYTIAASAWSNQRGRYHVSARATNHWEAQGREDLAAIETSLDSLTTTTSSHTSTLSSHTSQLALLGSGVQYVTGSSATITTADIVFCFSSGSGADLTLPAATADRKIWIVAFTDAYPVTLTRAGSETFYGSNGIGVTGPYTIAGGTYDFSLTLVFARNSSEWIVCDGVAGSLELARTDIATNTSNISTNTSDITNLKAGVVPSGNIRNTTTAGPHTIVAGETLVRQGYAGSMAYTLPAATAGARIRIIKDTTNAGAITLTRAGSDTIHGSASVYTLDGSTYVTSATTYRAEWDVHCIVAGDWIVQANAVALAATVASNTSSISSNTTSITNLQNGYTPSANVRNITSGTTATLLAGETLVRQASANAMVLTLPAAAVGVQIDIIKETTNAGTITLARAGSDTIHGSASNFELPGSAYVTSPTAVRYRWTVSCLNGVDWTVT